jgi:hypothetical protein
MMMNIIAKNRACNFRRKAPTRTVLRGSRLRKKRSKEAFNKICTLPAIAVDIAVSSHLWFMPRTPHALHQLGATAILQI